LFNKFKKASIANRVLEESLYQQVANELAEGMRRDGLWAKALANAEGDEKKAKGLYLKYRVQSLLDEAEIEFQANEIRESQERNKDQLEKNRRVNIAQSDLNAKGYKLKSHSNYWTIIEPLGGRQRIESLDELEAYAKSRR
jgi:hypothetical protein